MISRYRLLAAALVFVALVCAPYSLVRAQDEPYTFYRILPTNQQYSPAMDVNDDGIVVGYWVGPPVSTEPNTNSRGYLWTIAAGPVPVITDPTTVNMFPLHRDDWNSRIRINPGGSLAALGCPQGCGVSLLAGAIWSPSAGLGFLPGFGNTGLAGVATDVNASLQVIGNASGGGYNNAGPYIWSPATGTQQLAGFDGLNGTANGINANGVVAGEKGTGTRQIAFVWSAGEGLTNIPDLPGTSSSSAAAINDSGVVVGRYVVADQTTYHVFRWSAESGTEDLNAPAGLPERLDINNAGDIVATINTGAGGRVPYLYKNGVWTNVNDLLPAGTAFTIQYVQAINNRGWIVGSGREGPFGGGQGFVLVPPNHAPVATDDSLITSENIPISGTLIATDADSDPLTYSIVANPSRGTVTITNTTTGAFTYTPNAGAKGTDTFTFKVNDGSLDSNIATVSVTITSVNACATDISSTVAVTAQGSLKLNRKTGRYTQTLTLKNGDGAAAGPVSLVFDNLRSGLTLFGSAGTTSCTSPAGSPYIDVNVGADGVFSPRERATITVEFANTTGQPATYTTRVLTGTGSR